MEERGNGTIQGLVVSDPDTHGGNGIEAVIALGSVLRGATSLLLNRRTWATPRAILEPGESFMKAANNLSAG
ncbi:MAG: hypothetical protein ACOYEP_04480 [Limnochordia bacterium]